MKLEPLKQSTALSLIKTNQKTNLPVGMNKLRPILVIQRTMIRQLVCINKDASVVGQLAQVGTFFLKFRLIHHKKQLG